MSSADGAVEPSVFTHIIRGDLPGRFVWRDDDVVAFLTIAPLKPGHTLVVPIEQVDHWTDLEPELWLKVCAVQQTVGRALQAAFSPVRVGSIIAGLEVPHCHVHLVPINSESELSFTNVNHSPEATDLDAATARVREALRAMGCSQVVDS